MSFFDYVMAKKEYINNPFMTDIIQGFEDLDLFHLLRSGVEIPQSFFQKYSLNTASELIKWLSICNGGLLFSTTLISYTKHDSSMNTDFLTFDEVNSTEHINEFGLPKGFFVIALLNYGDPICISVQDSRIYLWDAENQAFSTIWDSLSDYLADEYNTAVNMIEDDALFPIPLKEPEDKHE